MRTPLISCLAGLLLATAGPAARAAEWTQLPHPASSGMTLYADPATEQRKHGKVMAFFVGNPVQGWFVTDYAAPHRWQVHRVMSIKQQLEFDCEAFSMRMLTRLYYDSPMAQGRVVASEPEARASARVVPGEPEASMLQSACARARDKEKVEQKVAAPSPTLPPAAAPAP